MSGATNFPLNLQYGALYWKNNMPVVLPNPFHNTVGGSLISTSAALAIAVNGNDVYATGYGQEILHPSDSLYIAQDEAVYWKNGVPVKLSSQFSRASAIALNGNDVYISGYNVDQAVYWKNGVLVNLPDSLDYAETTGIAIAGSDVYVIGYISDNNIGIPIYWKNGVAHSLKGNFYYSVATGISISGTDVYIAGYASNSATNNYFAVYWKNGIPVAISQPNQSFNSYANSIAISGADVYIAGSTQGVSVYWKNGTINKMPGSGGLSSIVVNGNDLYIGGTSDLTTSRHWKNAIPTDLTPTNASVTGIAVVTH